MQTYKKNYDLTKIPENSKECFEYTQNALPYIAQEAKAKKQSLLSKLNSLLARIDKAERKLRYVVICSIGFSLCLPSCKVIERAHREKYSYAYEQTEEECEDFNLWKKPLSRSANTDKVKKGGSEQ